MVNHFLNLAGLVGRDFFRALRAKGVQIKNRRAEANKMFGLPGIKWGLVNLLDCTERVFLVKSYPHS